MPQDLDWRSSSGSFGKFAAIRALRRGEFNCSIGTDFKNRQGRDTDEYSGLYIASRHSRQKFLSVKELRWLLLPVEKLQALPLPVKKDERAHPWLKLHAAQLT